MADQSATAPVPAAPGAPVPGAPAPAAPKVLPTLVLYTLGRLAIVAVLVGLLWALGLAGIPGMLFGLLLSMPVAYVVLRRVRDRLTAALIARADAKEALRARLHGSEADDAAASP